MPRESALASLETINNEDYLRIVTADGRSRRVLVSALEQSPELEELTEELRALDARTLIEYTQLSGDVEALDNRVDNIISGVTVDTEVIDARTGHDGTVYTVLKDALDAQFEAVDEAIADIDALSDEVKDALLDCFQHVAWIDAQGQNYYDALEHALYPRELVSISAVFDSQGETIYTDDSLEDLRQYLTVTANYDDSSTEIVTDYVLSGNLSVGTSTITVTYSEKTTTFSVTVVQTPYLYRMRDVPITLDGTTGINTGFQMLSENRSFTLVCEFVDNKQYTVDNVAGYLFGCYVASSPYTGAFMQVYDGGSATIDDVEARKIRHVFRATPKGTSGGQTIFDNIIPITQMVGRVVRFCFAYNSGSGTVDLALSVDGVAITPSVPTVEYDFTAITAPLMAGSRLGVETQSNFMKGTYNDFKVFNYAFTSSEIEAYIGGEE